MDETSAGDGWALPGAPAEPEPEPPAPGGRAAAGRPTGAGGDAPSGERTFPGTTGLLIGHAAGDDVPVLALRPLTVADILDGAFGIMKARAARILGVTAVFVVPVFLLVAAVQQDASTAGYSVWDVLTRPDDPEVSQAIEEDSAGPADVGESLVSFTVSGLVLVAVAAAIAHLLGAWAAGRDAPAGELLAVVGRRSWALFASFVLVHLVEAPGLLLCGVGSLFIMPLFVAVAPVIGAEGAGPLRAIQRSVRLAARRYWPTLGVSLLIGIVGVLLGLALGGLPMVLVLTFGWDIAWPLLALGQIMGSVVVTPFVAGATVLLYLDLRVRDEGLDLELAVRDLFRERAA